MNRLFWFALGSISTLTAGIVYLATREEELSCPTAESPGIFEEITQKPAAAFEEKTNGGDHA